MNLISYNKSPVGKIYAAILDAYEIYLAITNPFHKHFDERTNQYHSTRIYYCDSNINDTMTFLRMENASVNIIDAFAEILYQSHLIPQMELLQKTSRVAYKIKSTKFTEMPMDAVTLFDWLLRQTTRGRQNKIYILDNVTEDILSDVKHRSECVVNIHEKFCSEINTFSENLSEQDRKYIVGLKSFFCAPLMVNALVNAKRKYFIKYYGWAIPSHDAIQKICTHMKSFKCLEIGAGLGLWSRLLKDNGINIVASSLFCKEFPRKKYSNWTEVEQIDSAKATLIHKPECLFVSWGYNLLKSALQIFDGNLLIIIGEPHGGCTDSIESNFDASNIFNAENMASKNARADLLGFSLIDTIELPNWPETHDACFVYAR